MSLEPLRSALRAETDLEVLRFEVDLANARTTLLRLQGAADVARGDLNAVMVEPTDKPIEPTDALAFVETAAEGTIAAGIDPTLIKTERYGGTDVQA